MMQLIGDKIRTLRRKRGLSQEQLGAMVGFSQSKISKIENGDWDSLSDVEMIGKRIRELRRKRGWSQVTLTEITERDAKNEKSESYFFGLTD